MITINGTPAYPIKEILAVTLQASNGVISYADAVALLRRMALILGVHAEDRDLLIQDVTGDSDLSS